MFTLKFATQINVLANIQLHLVIDNVIEISLPIPLHVERFETEMEFPLMSLVNSKETQSFIINNIEKILPSSISVTLENDFNFMLHTITFKNGFSKSKRVFNFKEMVLKGNTVHGRKKEDTNKLNAINPLVGVASNSQLFLFIFKHSVYSIYNRRFRSVQVGYPRPLVDVKGNKIKVVSCFNFADNKIALIGEDQRFFLGLLTTAGLLNVKEEPASTFLGLTPAGVRSVFARGINAEMLKINNQFAGQKILKGQYFVLYTGDILKFWDNASGSLIEVGQSKDIFPFNGADRNRIVAITGDTNDSDLLYVFFQDGTVRKLNRKVSRDKDFNLSLNLQFTGIVKNDASSQVFSSLELYTLTCEDTGEAGFDEVLIEVKSSGALIFKQQAKMNELGSFTEAEDPEAFRNARMILNKRIPFLDDITVSITEFDSSSANDSIGTLSFTRSDHRKTQHIFKGNGNYKLSYRVQGRDAKDVDLSSMFLTWRFFNDHYKRAFLGDHQNRIANLLLNIEEDIAEAATLARDNAQEFNEGHEKELHEDLEGAAKEIGVSAAGAAFGGAVISASSAVIVGTAAGATSVGAAAGIAAIKAVIATGGVALIAMAAVAAIALPVYFATRKQTAFLLVANNLGVDLKVERILAINSFQDNGTFEGEVLLRNTPGGIALGMFAFEKIDGVIGIDVEILLKPISIVGERELVKDGVKLIINVPFSGTNTASIEFLGNSGSDTVSSFSEIIMDDKTSEMPNIIAMLSEV
ncbi:MAG: hypothetical protein AB8G15_15810 [Saprospiraceae bacterium]